MPTGGHGAKCTLANIMPPLDWAMPKRRCLFTLAQWKPANAVPGMLVCLPLTSLEGRALSPLQQRHNLFDNSKTSCQASPMTAGSAEHRWSHCKADRCKVWTCCARQADAWCRYLADTSPSRSANTVLASAQVRASSAMSGAALALARIAR